jgi:hypothetical protein
LGEQRRRINRAARGCEPDRAARDRSGDERFSHVSRLRSSAGRGEFPDHRLIQRQGVAIRPVRAVSQKRFGRFGRKKQPKGATAVPRGSGFASGFRRLTGRRGGRRRRHIAMLNANRRLHRSAHRRGIRVILAGIACFPMRAERTETSRCTKQKRKTKDQARSRFRKNQRVLRWDIEHELCRNFMCHGIRRGLVHLPDARRRNSGNIDRWPRVLR